MAYIPINTFRTEIAIKKSRFIGIGFPINSPEEAREKLKELKIEFPDSRHICYAFLWGKNSTHMGMSDDGEPSGTAGRPMLEVVKGSSYENILVACVRYFGGIKLGTGGLVKAYTEITKLVIEGIPVEEYIEKITLKVTLPYNLFDNIKKSILSYEGVIDKEEFLSDIYLEFTIPVINRSLINEDITNISKGLVECTLL